MGHFARLQLVGRATYYIGWLALFCGALVHMNVGRPFFMSISLTQRNLFEVSIICFLICIASELRLREPAGEGTGAVKKQAAA
jgi:hypothetical protein